LSAARTLRVAVLASRRAPGLDTLISEARDGRRFEIACVLTTEEEFAGREAAESAGIPCRTHPLREFHRARGAALSDRAARAEYDRETVGRLTPFAPDLLLLSSYLYVLTEPMLAAFPGRIFNVHGSDLAGAGPGGKPFYPGLRAVRDAIFAGEAETRATLHLVTSAVDGGPALLRSWAFPVSPLASSALELGEVSALKAYAFAHQEWMLATAWGPLLAEGLRRIEEGGLRLRRGRFWRAGSAGPWTIPPPAPPVARAAESRHRAVASEGR
jgi:phosphoribosylglycinamide formyltransferase-1